jgi:hypothetical protein
MEASGIVAATFREFRDQGVFEARKDSDKDGLPDDLEDNTAKPFTKASAKKAKAASDKAKEAKPNKDESLEEGADGYNLSLAKVEAMLKKYGGKKERSYGKPDMWSVPGARSGVNVWHSSWKDGHAEKVEIAGVAGVYAFEKNPLRDLEKALKGLGA